MNRYSRFGMFVILFVCMAGAPGLVRPQDKQEKDDKAADKDKKPTEGAPAKEESSVTDHTIKLGVLPRARLESAMIQAGRLCSRLRAAPVETGELSLTITVSAGVAELRRGSEDWQKLLSRADAAMYEAKAQGRDRWVAAQ